MTAIRIFKNFKGINNREKSPFLKNRDWSGVVVLYDRNLMKQKSFSHWISNCPHSIGLNSGESLKTLRSYEKVMGEIFRSTQKNKIHSFVSVGGGSVGDFVGFCASTFKRGLDLIHIPTTALAAIDSAHGGKTALNLTIGSKTFKNQIGTFYSAQEVWFVEEAFNWLPESTLLDGYGEALKISLIEGGELWKHFSQELDWNVEILMKYLPQFVASKMKIVKKDPLEKEGARQVLNFGHTMGHVLEAQLKLSHGLSVLLGMAFAQEWGIKLGITPKQIFIVPDHRLALKKLKNIESFLLQDKKRESAQKIQFIFIEKPGKVVRHLLSVHEIVQEVRRQVASLEKEIHDPKIKKTHQGKSIETNKKSQNKNLKQKDLVVYNTSRRIH